MTLERLTKAEALLDDQVKRLAGASESLTNALLKPVVRGSWGEMTLGLHRLNRQIPHAD